MTSPSHSFYLAFRLPFETDHVVPPPETRAGRMCFLINNVPEVQISKGKQFVEDMSTASPIL
jgi:hypothetical protein